MLNASAQLLDKQFHCTYEVPTPTRINRSGEPNNYFKVLCNTLLSSAVYNDCSGDVVTSGPGNITVRQLISCISYKMMCPTTDMDVSSGWSCYQSS